MAQDTRDRRAYMREYQREWIRRRRDEWITAHGPCRNCGSTENLEVDHIDPATKLYQPREIWSRRADVREAELAKCQVLCTTCHLAKSIAAFPPLEHGQPRKYRLGCRCRVCRDSEAARRKAWRAKRRQQATT